MLIILKKITKKIKKITILLKSLTLKPPLKPQFNILPNHLANTKTVSKG